MSDNPILIKNTKDSSTGPDFTETTRLYDLNLYKGKLGIHFYNHFFLLK